MADNGGSTLRLKSPGSAAKRPAAPPLSQPVIPARHFHDPHDHAFHFHKETLAEIIDSLTDPPPKPVVHAKHHATGDAPPRHSKTSVVRTHRPATATRHAGPQAPSSRVVAVTPGVKAVGVDRQDRPLSTANKQQALSSANRPQAKPSATEPHVQYKDIQAKAAANEMTALRALSAAYAKDPHLLDNNDSAWEPIVAVVTRANAPLAEKLEDLASRLVQTNAAIHLLDRVTKDIDPRLAAEVVRLALPTYEKFHQDHKAALPDSALFGPVGMTALVELASRIAGTPHGDDAVARFAAIGGLHTGAVIGALAAGAGPAYAIEFARQLKADGIDPSLVHRAISDGMVQFRRAIVAGAEADIERLAEHNRELAWLADNDGAACAPKQFNNAVESYTNTGAWKAQGETLCRQLSDKGTMLIHYISALKSTPPEAGCDDLIARTLETLMNDPATSQAISLAAKNNPALLRELENMAGRFASDTYRKCGEFVRKLTGEVASSILRKTVFEKLKNIDLSNPASVELAEKELESLRGFGPGNQEKVIQELKRTIDEIAKATSGTNDPTTLRTAQAAALKKLNDKLVGDPSIVKAFGRDTLQGLLFRGFAVGLASLNLYNNARKFMGKRDLQTGIQAFAAAADFAQKGCEFLVGLGAADKASAIGRFGGGWRLMGRATAGDLISVISAGLETVNGVRLLAGWGVEQDTGGAVFSFASAAGGGLIASQAFGAATWTGPVGVGITAVSLVGKEIYRNAEDAHKYEEASWKFLIAAGYNAEAAKALGKRGDYLTAAAGKGQMPFLAKYAEFKQKMSPEGLRDWINRLSPDQVRRLSEVVLVTMEGLDGPPHSRQPSQWTGAARSQGVMYGPTPALIFEIFEAELRARKIPYPSSPPHGPFFS